MVKRVEAAAGMDHAAEGDNVKMGGVVCALEILLSSA